MCIKNDPINCSECAFLTVRNNISCGNIGNLIKCLIVENKPLKELSDYINNNIQLFQLDKEYNTVLSGICSHKNEEEILQFLPIIKICNYRFDKWYLHYAILNKKNNVIEYLMKHGCPIRQQHLQSAIISENKFLIKEILKKCDYILGEKIQKNIAEWLLEVKDEEVYKLCIPFSNISNQKPLIVAATKRNYYLLYLFLQRVGLHLTISTSNKILEICYSNFIPEINNKITNGIHIDIEIIQPNEKTKWFKECIDWCELSPVKRYFKFIEGRNKVILDSIEDYISKDVVNLLITYLN